MIESITINSWIIIYASIMLVGFAKAGIAGAGTITIPILAAILGGKISVGFLLPVLIFADTIAVIYYKQFAQWKVLYKILPWAMIGIILGTIVGNKINDKQFHILLVSIIFIGVAITIWREISKKKSIPNHWSFIASIGILAGFSSMIGNASGPIMSIFLLILHLDKKEFAGTYAWFFFITNIIKVPFHIFIWHTITIESCIFDLYVLPAVIAGMFLGFKLVKLLPEKLYKHIILGLTIFSAIALLFK